MGETGEFEFNLSWASCTSMLKLLLSVPGATPSRGRAYNGETPVISIKVDADVPAAFAPGWSFHAADADGTSASTQSGGRRTAQKKKISRERAKARMKYSGFRSGNSEGMPGDSSLLQD